MNDVCSETAQPLMAATLFDRIDWAYSLHLT